MTIMSQKRIINNLINTYTMRVMIPNIQNKEKIKNYNPYSITLNDLNNYDFSIHRLSELSSIYNLNKTGSKSTLKARIYSYLKLSQNVSKISAIYRGYLYRKYINLHHEGVLNRYICNNSTDFYTGDYIDKIPVNQYYSITENGFVYGFDIISLIKLTDTLSSHFNPYTRTALPSSVVLDINEILRLANILNIDIKITLDEEVIPGEVLKTCEEKISMLFDDIQSLGFYVDKTWYTSLTFNRALHFIEVLYDIWIHRAQLSIQTQCDICSPGGNPFVNINMRNLKSFTIDQLNLYVIKILHYIINTGINDAYRNIGALYVLIALSTVNRKVIDSMPWIEYAL